ncbi:MAG: tetratricopeptide repeat protein [Flammeovirgaceae bacterium]|nr:MAG: tetratricopeptide repeat protein [Flammeovirgaceae bacterium]
MMRRLLLFILVLSASVVYSQQKWSALETEGDTLLNNQQFLQAIGKYNKVVSLQKKAKYSGTSLVRYKRAVCLYYLQEFNLALADLDAFIPANPSFYQARLLRAFIYRELGDPEKQLIDINEVLTSDPWNVDLLKWRAGVMLETGEYAKAQADLLKVQEIRTDEEVELYLGLTWYYLDNPDEALNQFNKAIELNGGYAPAYQYAGILCIEQDAYELALTYVDLALRLEPGNTQLTFYKGIALVETGKNDEGCRLLNKAFYAGIDDAAGYLMKFCYQVED